MVQGRAAARAAPTFHVGVLDRNKEYKRVSILYPFLLVLFVRGYNLCVEGHNPTHKLYVVCCLMLFTWIVGNPQGADESTGIRMNIRVTVRESIVMLSATKH